MPTITDVQKLATELHNKKAINLDMPIRDLLEPQGIGVIDPSGPLQDNVIAWSEYVLVTSGKTKLIARDAIDTPVNR
ncbi:MAG: hypothetical protein JJ926_13475 [Roseitalea sp.]|jgi:hypothetical protein|uniref:Uncharacterized protein n=1 Tax=Oceaniradius stylonematis TaxID=2184161 RepID=A0A3A8AGU4_9HYPH|nr:hypothetical protein [Oceaniradius stylonematis]MBO6554203.1 hypothetical protein [Roseitalea sp.]MBO6953247.1 hypothetical protein [Rhizobiaceae bacterium]RNC91211.1 MAG: hypothetical protein ED558_14815 [Oricola sp.]MBO6593594.1 hypothetical protein [Roseitalea sp.]MBO6600990.1 hypothetical protein [Roseitalea sp.]